MSNRVHWQITGDCADSPDQNLLRRARNASCDAAGQNFQRNPSVYARGAPGATNRASRSSPV